MPSDAARHGAHGARATGRFAPILGAVAGLVVWALHFGAVYGANAVACARGLAGRELLGLPLVPALVLGATALALAAVAAIGLLAWRRVRGGGLAGGGEDDPHFAARLSAMVALLAALAIVWETVPALVLHPCG